MELRLPGFKSVTLRPHFQPGPSPALYEVNNLLLGSSSSSFFFFFLDLLTTKSESPIFELGNDS